MAVTARIAWYARQDPRTVRRGKFLTFFSVADAEDCAKRADGRHPELHHWIEFEDPAIEAERRAATVVPGSAEDWGRNAESTLAVERVPAWGEPQ